MKLTGYIGIILILFLSACKKDGFKTFEVEKSYTITDTLLKNKYITPIQRAKIVRMILKPKDNSAPTTFYIIQQTEGKYAMLGKSRAFADPAVIDLKFGTNATTAIIDFTETSLLGSIISDMGQELTRGADYVYSFVRVIPGGFELEGNQYGDHLTLMPLDPQSAEGQHILTGGILKDFMDIDRLFDAAPFQSTIIDGKPLQLVVDANTSSTWIFYSGENDKESISVDLDNGYKPTVSRGISYASSANGDSLLFFDEVAVGTQLLQGLVWNQDRTGYKVLVGPKGKTTSINLNQSKIPVISYTEMTSFLTSEHQESSYYEQATTEEKNIISINRRLTIPVSFKFDFDSLATYTDYGKGWTVAMKNRAKLLAEKIKTLGTNVTQVRFESQAKAGFRELFTDYYIDDHVGMSHQITIRFNNNGQKDSVSYRQNVLALDNGLSFSSPVTYYGFQNPKFMLMKIPTKPANLVKVWPEFYDFFQAYENATLQSSYLVPAKENGPIRVNMTSKKTGDTFIGYCY